MTRATDLLHSYLSIRGPPYLSRYSDGLQGSIPGRGNIFLFSTAYRPALGPTHPPIQWVPGLRSPGVKRPDREADHSPPSSAEVNNGGAIPPPPRMSSWLSA
jgi:hypothetical protein